jgi:demethylmenaquinone methyltransferase/2-methoxy-6-polyprenyl-1,4-benzoquinol methylase
MFGRIARRYDLMNGLMTFGQDRVWQREVARRAALPRGGRLLDIGSGTGGIVSAACRQVPGLTAVAADFSLAMMTTGRSRLPQAAILWCGADALALPFADETFDAVTSGYLIRNVVDIGQAFREQVRVVRPGGKVVCLETSPPPAGPLRPFIIRYLRTVIPLAGRLIGGDRDAYRYLPESTQQFLPPEKLAARMQDAGLERIGFDRRMHGTLAILDGTKPGRRAL